MRAGQRQQQALGEQLPDQASASGADRRADRQLHVPGRASREHEARDVDAGDDQDQADRQRQGVNRGAELAGLVVVHRLDHARGPGLESASAILPGAVTASRAARA